MLYQLLYPLHNQLSALNVIQYITFRTAAAGLTAFVISMTLGPWTIRTLRGFQIGQGVRDDGPARPRAKAGPPIPPAKQTAASSPSGARPRSIQVTQLLVTKKASAKPASCPQRHGCSAVPQVWSFSGASIPYRRMS